MKGSNVQKEKHLRVAWDWKCSPTCVQNITTTAHPSTHPHNNSVFDKKLSNPLRIINKVINFLCHSWTLLQTLTHGTRRRVVKWYISGGRWDEIRRGWWIKFRKAKSSFLILIVCFPSSRSNHNLIKGTCGCECVRERFSTWRKLMRRMLNKKRRALLIEIFSFDFSVTWIV